MLINLGMLYLSQAFHAASVPTWIPDPASTMITAASAARRAAFTSPIKSKYPGVSIKFILLPFHSIGTTDVLMEYPFSTSILS